MVASNVRLAASARNTCVAFGCCRRYHGVAGCITSLAGVVLVARPPFLFGGHEEWARSRCIGTIAGVLSAVLGGGSSMAIRIIGGSEPAAVIGEPSGVC